MSNSLPHLFKTLSGILYVSYSPSLSSSRYENSSPPDNCESDASGSLAAAVDSLSSIHGSPCPGMYVKTAGPEPASGSEPAFLRILAGSGVGGSVNLRGDALARR